MIINTLIYEEQRLFSSYPWIVGSYISKASSMYLFNNCVSTTNLIMIFANRFSH